ncbi:GMC family oxidoreductase [Nocardia altamirensis]|uniref:GMC family oxidoreductase n=1 Tax=Nocardia altamirensis TaxID=472158 RepID=UPI0008408661|nr:GMC oxidoreductase [Nocardia altamirensis]
MIIVVGAGSAGCVVADRLTEDPREVMLLEAGPDYPVRFPDEMLDGRSMATTHDWGYSVPRPRVVGGSSATNATFAFPGDGVYGDWDYSAVLRTLPISVYGPEELTEVQRAFLLAAPDAAPIPMNRVGAVRQNAAMTYLARARRRTNLTIRSDCLVHQLLVDDDRVVGVRAGDTELRADHVVLAAGAFGSPMILLRSGIGPAEDLRRLGIPVRLDLPVGTGLTDHPLWELRYATAKPTPGGPDFQVLLSLLDAQIFPTSARRCGILASPTGAYFGLTVSAMHPNSAGTVRLSSAHPEAPPVIDFRHLADQADRDVMVAAAQLARTLATTEPMASLVRRELYPGPEADLEATIVRDVTTYHHASGSCAAVVERTGRVHGLRGLSVVDASVLAPIPGTNIHLTVLALAERWCRVFAGDQADAAGPSVPAAPADPAR